MVDKNVVVIEKSNLLYDKPHRLSSLCKATGLMHGLDYKWYYIPDALAFEFKEQKNASIFALTCL
jgi:hypothetical protein